MDKRIAAKYGDTVAEADDPIYSEGWTVGSASPSRRPAVEPHPEPDGEGEEPNQSDPEEPLL